VSDQRNAPAALLSGKVPPVHIWYEAGWDPGQVWTTWRTENSRPHQDSNSNFSVVQPVASHYTDYTIPDPSQAEYDLKHNLYIPTSVGLDVRK
jgi:hypothetical protein